MGFGERRSDWDLVQQGVSQDSAVAQSISLGQIETIRVDDIIRPGRLVRKIRAAFEQRTWNSSAYVEDA